jgi:hypothetical protein
LEQVEMPGIAGRQAAVALKPVLDPLQRSRETKIRELGNSTGIHSSRGRLRRLVFICRRYLDFDLGFSGSQACSLL